MVAATLVGRQSCERRSSQLVLWCARTKTSSLRRRSLVAAKMQTRSQGLELWWWRGEAETKERPLPHTRRRMKEESGPNVDNSLTVVGSRWLARGGRRCRRGFWPACGGILELWWCREGKAAVREEELRA